MLECAGGDARAGRRTRGGMLGRNGQADRVRDVSAADEVTCAENRRSRSERAEGALRL